MASAPARRPSASERSTVNPARGRRSAHRAGTLVSRAALGPSRLTRPECRRARGARKTPGPFAIGPHCDYRRTGRTSPPTSSVHAAATSFSAYSPGSPAAVTLLVDVEQRERSALVTVLGLSYRAAVDEHHAPV